MTKARFCLSGIEPWRMEGEIDMKIEIVDMSTIGRIEPMWEKLIEANGDNSPYFKELYATFEFGIRCGFLHEKEQGGSRVWTAVLYDDEKGCDAGFVTATYNPQGKYGEVEMLYVKEEYRGFRHGRELFKLALDELDANGITDKKLCVTYGNDAALRLYQSFGFYPFTIDCLYKG